MTTEPGRAAYEAWASQMLDQPDWDDLPDETRAAWKHVETAAGGERVAELVSEGNELRGLVGEILGKFHPAGHYSNATKADLAAWRERAGLSGQDEPDEPDETTEPED